ncbi:MAG: DNA-deoxyinosine glycosylase [Ruminococcus sp.]|nr:DNA-deoxyinosine glycosylase [Ruminococcus sp.]
MERIRIKHEFEPVYDKNSRILILGSLPSVKSREQSFYYGHPQNRFWRVISSLCKSPLPETTEDKKLLLLSNRIAVWDVIAECDISGSSDASIRNVTPTQLSLILDNADIRRIFLNGSKAFDIYERWQKPITGREAVKLPSTSPANAAWSFEKLLKAWSVILDDLK